MSTAEPSYIPVHVIVAGCLQSQVMSVTDMHNLFTTCKDALASAKRFADLPRAVTAAFRRDFPDLTEQMEQSRISSGGGSADSFDLCAMLRDIDIDLVALSAYMRGMRRLYQNRPRYAIAIGRELEVISRPLFDAANIQLDAMGDEERVRRVRSRNKSVRLLTDLHFCFRKCFPPVKSANKSIAWYVNINTCSLIFAYMKPLFEMRDSEFAKNKTLTRIMRRKIFEITQLLTGLPNKPSPEHVVCAYTLMQAIDAAIAREHERSVLSDNVL